MKRRTADTALEIKELEIHRDDARSCENTIGKTSNGDDGAHACTGQISGGVHLKRVEKKDTKHKKDQEPNRVELLDKRKIFPFASLPGELRNAIYEICLLMRQGIYLSLASGSPGINFSISMRGWRGALPRPFTNLIYLDRSTHAEAVSILYANRFHFYGTLPLERFLAMISPAIKAHVVAHLAIVDVAAAHYFGADFNRAASPFLGVPGFCALVGMSNLSSVRVQVEIHRGATAAVVARRVLREFGPVVRAFGRAKGNVMAFLEVLDLECSTFLDFGLERGEAADGRRVRAMRAQIYAEMRERLH
ncbi:hypothetical protein B0J12DRAFT_723618 [Macrophomina phaseolina]|uniref:Uncharacterized protein n=1 Tax=Macrophomina phaseolina TaxID=35725 RepID=A0ABQ8GRD1_9PEZI|nr:hypothetical protein B0J12DRAFT_723618 [Macrophomina phaseolina]